MPPTRRPSMPQQPHDARPVLRKTAYTVAGADADGTAVDEPVQRTRYELTYTVTRPINAPVPVIFGRHNNEKTTGEVVAEVLEHVKTLTARLDSEERRLAHANASLDYMLVTSWLGDLLLFALLGAVVWAGPWWYLRETREHLYS